MPQHGLERLGIKLGLGLVSLARVRRSFARDIHFNLSSDKRHGGRDQANKRLAYGAAASTVGAEAERAPKVAAATMGARAATASLLPMSMTMAATSAYLFGSQASSAGTRDPGGEPGREEETAQSGAALFRLSPSTPCPLWRTNAVQRHRVPFRLD